MSHANYQKALKICAETGLGLIDTLIQIHDRAVQLQSQLDAANDVEMIGNKEYLDNVKRLYGG